MVELSIETIRDAQERISKYIRRTPLIHSEFLSKLCDGSVYFKLENQQITNSFKIRGALYRMSQLSVEERKRGIITASSGNHAQGVALAAEHLKIPAIIVVPAKISKAKLDKIKKYDVAIIQEGDFNEIERLARELSIVKKLTYISPYNDLGIIAGQGTIALEILEETKQFNSIIVPVGGGGLISGIAIALKSLNPSIEVIGVQTRGASTLYESWKAGRIINIGESYTLAEGLLGGIEPDAITFELIKENVDDLVLVNEKSIEQAIQLLWKKEGQIVEGAGATVVAYILEEKHRFAHREVVGVISGGNIEDSLFQKILDSNL